MNFLRNTKYLLPFIVLTIGISCAPKKSLRLQELQIAIIADAHLQDVYGELQDSEYRGVKNPKNGGYALIRTMGSQLRSTRIFNENYFAFLAALDDIAKRNVRYVLLPGDFSDDGQPIHLRGLKRILEDYSERHGLSFYLIHGNHDVVRPFNRKDGKVDFLGEGGKRQPIMSHLQMYVADTIKEHPVIVSRDIQNLGYYESTNHMADFGFFPKADHIYWESPFSDYTYDTYNFEQAKEQASLKNRSLLLPLNDVPLPDTSYLVEPIEGLWLLALDANTYLKKERLGEETDSKDYPNTGIGHDNLLETKKYLLDWVGKVVKSSEEHGKTLIAFSHYPMVDFTNGATPEIDNLLVGSQMQLRRVPNNKVAELFADAGLKLHFGGHIHINDTGITTTEKGNTLVNVQVPSLAAYKPAYKLLTIGEKEIMEVETITLDSVPRLDEFFNLYEQEHTFLRSISDQNTWNKAVLTSKNYHEFMTWHLRELVRLRFLKSEWPSEFASFLLPISGKELLALSQTNTSEPLEESLIKIKNNHNKASGYWIKARESAHKSNLDFDRFDDWSGSDLVFDLYRLRSADELAFDDIGLERLDQYRLIIESFLKQEKSISDNDPMRSKTLTLLKMFQKFMNGEPSDHFQIHLKTGKVIPLNNKRTD
ncbi:metallophosphoesterase family protein [Ulvibacterium marinum]|uniref:metallophosphoesterase family protein n=1 Tax=Ulvibacterium marinum TaxID=2419782 RepID=UPI002495368F|nr:metallophosphoesterase [Ulvibacterium marinum]